ncbi:MAG: helix-turn-helix transcriptional regulator [Flavobacteriales bacterium]|jgi:hypothetical protein|tara:strand:+ start:810 stop:1010 length:201 start_codon:yes stop_codon:yes gene_type:complete
METTENLKFLTTRQLANMLSMSHRTLENWRGLGKGPRYRKVGGKILYDMRDVEDFINTEVVDPNAE